MSQNGKGDVPRNCFSEQYRSNYDNIFRKNKMKIGVIFTAYNMADMIHQSLHGWSEAKKNCLNGHEYLICGISIPFKKFKDPVKDNTLQILWDHINRGTLDNLITQEEPLLETEARTLALKYLMSKDIDVIIQVDADEFYSQKDISNIFSFVEKNSFISCFKGSLKNYVFNEKTFFKKPFNPMRIHRVKTKNGLVADAFWDDNNLLYKDGSGYVADNNLPNTTIPQSVAWVKHMSWLSNERSKKKIEYQTSRGWKCSFKWNDSENKLELDLENIILSGEEIPEIELEKD